MVAAGRVVEQAAECVYAALLLAERAAVDRPGVEASGLALVVSGAAGLLGEVPGDVSVLAGQDSCVGLLDRAAALLDAVAAADRPVGLVLARAYVADAQQAARGW